MKVVIINGSGGSGKDTIVELTRTYFSQYKVENISTIDDVKFIAHRMGWNGIKDEKGRQFLSDLKKIWTEYNNGANLRVLQKLVDLDNQENFHTKEHIVFVHCRETDAIEWFIERLENRKIKTCTVLIKRENIEKFLNSSDQNVDLYDYDITILNNGTIENLEKVCKKFADIISDWDINKRILS